MSQRHADKFSKRGAAVTRTQTKIDGNVYARQGLSYNRGYRERNHMCQQPQHFLKTGFHNQQEHISFD